MPQNTAPVPQRPEVIPAVPMPGANAPVAAPRPAAPRPEPGFPEPPQEAIDNGYVDLDRPNGRGANGNGGPATEMPDYDDGFTDLDALPPPGTGIAPRNGNGNGSVGNGGRAPEAMNEPYDDGFDDYDADAAYGSGDDGAGQPDHEPGLAHQPLDPAMSQGFPRAFADAPARNGGPTQAPTAPNGNGAAAPGGTGAPAINGNGTAGGNGAPAPNGNGAAAPARLDPADSRAIIETVAALDSGAPRYDALSLDGEFRGRFGKDHPYFQRAHAGLGFGIARFNQDDGTLGRLLRLMQERDPAAFGASFGANAADLLTVITAEGPASLDSPGGRSARVQPVAGKDLWEEPWVGRFRAAAQVPAFQAAQNQLAAQLYLDPVAPYMADLGLGSPRGLAIAYDRVVDMGLEAGLDFAVHSAGPVRTEAQRSSVLAALGMETLEDFQRSQPGITVDGIFGPQTHAAMVRALRALGPAAPVALPAYDEMLDALVRAAAIRPFGPRVARLRNEPMLPDVILLP